MEPVSGDWGWLPGDQSWEGRAARRRGLGTWQDRFGLDRDHDL